MESVLAIIATIIGATIAFASQWTFDRRHRRQRFQELLLEQSAILLALNDDFENRLWEERALGLENRVSEWDLTSSRLAKAKLQIISGSKDLDAAVATLHATGVELGRYWRQRQRQRQRQQDDAELERLLDAHRQARQTFLDASAVYGRKIGA
jgi:hypothetical protein